MWIKHKGQKGKEEILKYSHNKDREQRNKEEDQEEIENRCDTTQRCSISNLESSAGGVGGGCLAFPLDPVCSK